MIKKIIYLIFSILLMVTGLKAQNEVTGLAVRTQVEEVRNGRNFFVHTVGLGETLYSISKTYQIPMNDITALNNDMLLSLHTGQVIYVPTRSLTADDKGASYFYFFVAEKDMSLYQAAKLYKFDVDEFLKLNPTAIRGVKQGDIIRVPKERVSVVEEIVGTDSAKVVLPDMVIHLNPPCKNYVYNPANTTFKASVMLPFQYSLNSDALSLSNDNISKANFDRGTSRFIEYYQGILMAANNLRKQGVNIEISVYDTDKSLEKVKKIIDMGAVAKADIVFGPVYSDNFQLVADELQKERKPHISLMSKNTRLIADNDMAFQIVPSDLTQWEALADFFVYNGSTNFILVHRGNQAEIDALEVFKKKLTASVDAIGGRIKVSIVNYKLGGLSAIRDKLNGNSNTIVVPSEVEVFVTDLVAKLNTLAMSYPIELAGPQTWENFENVTFDYLHNLQFCTTTPSWVDYNNPNVKAFVEDYRLKFNSEPSQYAFYGYDTFLYFGQMLKSNGPNFSYCVENTKTDGLQSIWNFEKSTQLGGLENRGVWVLRYEKGTSLSAFKVFQDDERHVERVMTEAADNE